MTILTEQLEYTAKGSLNETEDWWTLCYDTDVNEFYVEHQWDHMDPYKLGNNSGSHGTSRLSADKYIGPGSHKLDEAKRKLLEKAKS